MFETDDLGLKVLTEKAAITILGVLFPLAILAVAILGG